MKKQLLTLITIAMIVMSCKKDEKPSYSINQSAITLNYDKTHQFQVKLGANDIDESTLTWTSSDETVGTISQSGLFIAKKIGKTTITGKNSQSSVISEVTITPYSTLCKEPFLELGSTVSVVKSKETRILAGENATGLIYTGENAKIRNALYIFKDNSLTSAAILLANNDSLVEEAFKFFGERYTFEGKSDDNILFFSNKNLIIGLSYNADLGFNAIYVKNTTGTTSKANISAMKQSYQRGVETIIEKQL